MSAGKVLGDRRQASIGDPTGFVVDSGSWTTLILSPVMKSMQYRNKIR